MRYAVFEAQHDLTPVSTQGRFWDIEAITRYKIPSGIVMAFGAELLEQAAPAYRIAAARQLKAILPVYDQIFWQISLPRLLIWLICLLLRHVIHK